MRDRVPMAFGILNWVGIGAMLLVACAVRALSDVPTTNPVVDPSTQNSLLESNVATLGVDDLIAKGMEAIQLSVERGDRVASGRDGEGCFNGSKLDLFALKCFNMAVSQSDPTVDAKATKEIRAKALADDAWWRFKVRPDTANIKISAQQLKDAIELNPSDARALTMLAYVILYQHHGSPESIIEASDDLRLALLAKPDLADAWYLKSQIETGEAQIADFREFLKDQKTLDPFMQGFDTKSEQKLIRQIGEIVGNSKK